MCALIFFNTFSIPCNMIQFLQCKPTNAHNLLDYNNVLIHQLLHVSGLIGRDCFMQLCTVLMGQWHPKHVGVDVLTFWHRSFTFKI